MRGHPEKALADSIQAIADRTGVSIASVSRLAAGLGYRGWKELRLSLAKEPQRGENPVLAAIAPDDSDAAVVEKVFNANILSLRDTLRQIDVGDVVRVVEAIAKTDRIVFFGTGGSGCIARDESLRFAHLELSAEAYSEEFQMTLQAARMAGGQVAFGFSNSGRSKTVVGVLSEAGRNGALTVGVSSFRNTRLEKASDVFFCTSFPRRNEMTAALTARIAVQCVMDCIYVLAAQRGRIAGRVGHVNEILEATLRFSAAPRRRAAGRRR